MQQRPPLLTALGLAAGLTAALAGCVGADERTVDFASIHATIIEPGCATSNCHSAMTQQSNIDLSGVEIACTTLVDGGYAVPGETTLVDMLQGESMFLEPMPLDGPLPPGQIALIAQWIEEGASCE